MAATDQTQSRPAGFLLIPSPETLSALERLRVFSKRGTLAETLAAMLQAFFWVDPLFQDLEIEVRELKKIPEAPEEVKKDTPYEQRPM